MAGKGPRSPLASWKEIADYLDCAPRTAQRYARTRGLPVHHLAGEHIQRVFAYADEIDRWREEGTREDEGERRTPNVEPPTPKGEEARTGLYLVVTRGSTAGERRPLDGSGVDLGRGFDCGLRIDDAGVSRRHARVEPGPGGVLLRDLGSKNGTYHNGRQIQAPIPLREGDRIGLGQGVELRLESDTLPETAGEGPGDEPS